ncbi:hypothetical protein NL676_034423 [Syzygium grande]|nr:hypothetical protein NL676_034423 [Syzygium grande]
MTISPSFGTISKDGFCGLFGDGQPSEAKLEIGDGGNGDADQLAERGGRKRRARESRSRRHGKEGRRRRWARPISFFTVLIIWAESGLHNRSM